MRRSCKSIFFTTSTDAELNFDEDKIISDCAGWDFPIKGLGRASGCASVGLDITRGKNRDSIYVCWGDTQKADADVSLVVSRDGGETWSKPLYANTDDKGKQQWFLWLVVDLVDGSVNIAYYDRSSQEGKLTDVTPARSVDGGRSSAAAEKRLTRTSPRSAPRDRRPPQFLEGKKTQKSVGIGGGCEPFRFVEIDVQ